MHVLCRVLLPYVHVLVPQQISLTEKRKRHGDMSAKFRKLKEYIKTKLPDHHIVGKDAADKDKHVQQVGSHMPSVLCCNNRSASSCTPS